MPASPDSLNVPLSKDDIDALVGELVAAHEVVEGVLRGYLADSRYNQAGPMSDVRSAIRKARDTLRRSQPLSSCTCGPCSALPVADVLDIIRNLLSMRMDSVCRHFVCLRILSEMEERGIPYPPELAKTISDNSEGDERSLQIVDSLISQSDKKEPLTLQAWLGLVYDILVAIGGTQEMYRDSFIQSHVDKDHPCTEWRILDGVLGFGGKYRFKNNSVDYYPEDDTRERAILQSVINQSLSALPARPPL